MPKGIYKRPKGFQTGEKNHRFGVSWSEDVRIRILASREKNKEKTRISLILGAKKRLPISDETRKKRSESLKKWFAQNGFSEDRKMKIGSANRNPDREQAILKHGWRRCSEYSIWSKAVKVRDNWKCRIGDSTCDRRREAHHILPAEDYPELRFNINNGITLCHVHHPRHKKKVMDMVSIFQELVSYKATGSLK